MAEIVILGAIGAVGLGLASLGGLLYARVHDCRRALRRRKPAGEDLTARDPAWAPLGRYQPMFRLLSGEDGEFLAMRPQCPQTLRQWERSQRRIVRLYLKELAVDFESLHREARALVAQSPEHSRRLLPRLLRQQAAFWWALMWIEVRLSLPIARINPQGLVAAFEGVRREVSRPVLAQDQLAL